MAIEEQVEAQVALQLQHQRRMRQLECFQLPILPMASARPRMNRKERVPLLHSEPLKFTAGQSDAVDLMKTIGKKRDARDAHRARLTATSSRLAKARRNACLNCGWR